MALFLFLAHWVAVISPVSYLRFPTFVNTHMLYCPAFFMLRSPVNSHSFFCSFPSEHGFLKIAEWSSPRKHHVMHYIPRKHLCEIHIHECHALFCMFFFKNPTFGGKVFLEFSILWKISVFWNSYRTFLMQFSRGVHWPINLDLAWIH